MKRLALLFHTLRYLRARQLFFQLYYRLVPARAPSTGGAASVRAGRVAAGIDCSPYRPFGTPATDDNETFHFLGATGHIAAPGDWNAPCFSKLWLYNLHYLNELNARGPVDAAQRDSLVDRWIAENPPGRGNGWEPYPLSLRLVNLVKWFTVRAPSQAWLDSLATQTRALDRRLEHHILGNHIFANGKALVFGGAFLGGAEADRWLRRGLKLLDREIREQFLADGGHFERSPMYHAALTWDLCDLIALAGHSDLSALRQRRDAWLEVTLRARNWLAAMSHPDGDIAFFNDAAFDIAPRLADIDTYLTRLGARDRTGGSECIGGSELARERPAKPAGGIPENPVGSTPEGHWDPAGASPLSRASSLPPKESGLLQDSGYLVAGDEAAGHRLILDVAPVGPDYQPGHAHADTLSFELSLFGQRVLVNSGTSEYGTGPERQRQRGTAAHNTVIVDGADSSQVWGGFRVARRARAVLETVVEEQVGLLARARHDGYRRLPGRNLHQREWRWRPADKAGDTPRLTVVDRVTGTFGEAWAHFYLHPAVAARADDSTDDSTFQLTLPGGEVLLLRCHGARRVALEPATWHPRFGEAVPNQCIVAAFGPGHTLTTELEFF